MIKKVWICWFQGENSASMPNLNKECIKKWKSLNSEFEIIFLSSENISDYVPEYFDFIEASPYRKPAHCADLLRLLLLSKYGGIWVDSSVWPMESLSNFYHKIVNETGFFTYRFIPRSLSLKWGNRETVVWFLCSDAPKNHLIESWKNKLLDKFIDKKTWKQYTMAETLCELYDTDKKVNFILNNMVQIDQKVPHSAIKSWRNKKPSYMYKRPKLILND